MSTGPPAAADPRLAGPTWLTPAHVQPRAIQSNKKKTRKLRVSAGTRLNTRETKSLNPWRCDHQILVFEICENFGASESIFEAGSAHGWRHFRLARSYLHAYNTEQHDTRRVSAESCPNTRGPRNPPRAAVRPSCLRNPRTTCRNFNVRVGVSTGPPWPRTTIPPPGEYSWRTNNTQCGSRGRRPMA